MDHSCFHLTAKDKTWFILQASSYSNPIMCKSKKKEKKNQPCWVQSDTIFCFSERKLLEMQQQTGRYNMGSSSCYNRRELKEYISVHSLTVQLKQVEFELRTIKSINAFKGDDVRQIRVPPHSAVTVYIQWTVCLVRLKTTSRLRAFVSLQILCVCVSVWDPLDWQTPPTHCGSVYVGREELSCLKFLTWQSRTYTR